MEQVRDYFTYWREAVKMWWRSYFRNWFLPVIGAFGLVVIFWHGVLEYRWWVLGITATVALIPLLFLIPYRMWKGSLPHVKARQKADPCQYVFPYIRTVNVSSVVDAGEKYLSLSVYFPSALSYDLELMTLTGILRIDGTRSKELAPKSIKINQQATSKVTDWRVDLTEDLVKKIKQVHQDQEPVKVFLTLSGKDRDNNPYDWETEEWTTLLLTKLD